MHRIGVRSGQASVRDFIVPSPAQVGFSGEKTMRSKARRTLIATAFLAAVAPPAQAWGIAMPQVISLGAHVLGGMAWAAWRDSQGADPVRAGAEIAAIGFLKEATDVSFYPDDWIAWPFGAWLWHAIQDSPHCFFEHSLSGTDQGWDPFTPPCDPEQRKREIAERKARMQEVAK
jgi:hypothetical protein